MKIVNTGCEPAIINIIDEHGNNFCLHYYRSKNLIHYFEQNNLAFYIKQNENQLLKILNSKRINSFIQGFQLEFVIIPDFYFIQNQDYNNYIVVDRTDGYPQVSVKAEPTKNIHEVYTDGSYYNLKHKTGFAYIIRFPDGEEKLFQERIDQRGNNIAELSAVTFALQKLKTVDKVCVYTDSRYVIKGFAQWIHYWRINDWRTVHDEEVKHKKLWSECEQLTRNFHMELKWIKSHSHHFENSLCDMMAKEAANKE